MAFRFFGLNTLPVYKANTGFMRFTGYTGRYLAEINLNGHGNAISQAAQLLRLFVQSNEVAENGEIRKNNVSDYISEITAGGEDEHVISFSKTLGGKEIAIIYNTSETDAKEKFILLDNAVNAGAKKMDIVYGYESCGHVHLFHGRHNENDISYMKIYLKPLHLVILKNY